VSGNDTGLSPRFVVVSECPTRSGVKDASSALVSMTRIVLDLAFSKHSILR
jgi:hypothetical protein